MTSLSLSRREFVLTAAAAAAIAGRKTVTLVFDIASEQSGRPNTFSIGKFPAAGGNIELGIGSRIYTLPGNHAKHRYAWTIKKGKNPSPGDDPKKRRPDITLAKKLLGWEPKVPLAEGLAKTIAYFESGNRKGRK